MGGRDDGMTNELGADLRGVTARSPSISTQPASGVRLEPRDTAAPDQLGDSLWRRGRPFRTTPHAAADPTPTVPEAPHAARVAERERRWRGTSQGGDESGLTEAKPRGRKPQARKPQARKTQGQAKAKPDPRPATTCQSPNANNVQPRPIV